MNQNKFINMTLLATVLIAVSACSDSAKTLAETTALVGDTQTVTAVETEIHVPPLDIPDGTDYGGSTFTVEAVDNQNTVGRAILNQFSLEEENGDILNDTVYKAVTSVEELLNLQFVQLYSKSVFDYQNLRKVAQAGDPSIDVFSYIDRFGVNQAAGGYVIPYEDIPGINLEHPWWYSEVNDAISIADHLCYAVGAMNLDVVAGMNCLLFNKTILAENQLENPYTLIDEGKWTVDRMYEMIASAVKDIDGDGTMSIKDVWGAVYTHDCWYSNFGPLSGEFIVEKDKDDLPYLNVLGNEALISIWQKLLGHTTTGNVFVVHNLGDTEIYKKDSSLYNEVLYMFMDGKSLFSSASHLYDIALLRDMEDDFGILPFPHTEEEAAGTVYGGYINGVGQPFFVPSSNGDLERTGFVFEALCREYYVNVVNPYLEEVAMTKQVRDEDSVRMLKMMNSWKVVDISCGYWWEQTNAQMYDVFKSGKDTFASTYEKKRKAAETALEKTIEIFRGFDETP